MVFRRAPCAPTSLDCRVISLLLILLGSSACADDPAVRALAYEGRSEAELVRDIGKPHVRKRANDVKNTEALAYCLSDKNFTSALEYHAPSSGLAYWLRRQIRSPPSVVVVVCVDVSGKITATKMISIN